VLTQLLLLLPAQRLAALPAAAALATQVITPAAAAAVAGPLVAGHRRLRLQQVKARHLQHLLHLAAAPWLHPVAQWQLVAAADQKVLKALRLLLLAKVAVLLLCPPAAACHLAAQLLQELLLLLLLLLEML
jgi:hypothetical protein